MNALIAAHTTVEVSRVLELLPEKDELLSNIAEATGVDFQADTEGHWHMLGSWHAVLDGHNQLTQAVTMNDIKDIEDLDTGVNLDLDGLIDQHMQKAEGEEGAAKTLSGAMKNKGERLEPGAVGAKVAGEIVSEIDAKLAAKRSGQQMSQLVEPSAEQLKFTEEGLQPNPAAALGGEPDAALLGLGLYSAMAGQAGAELKKLHTFDIEGGTSVAVCTGSIVTAGGDALVNDCDRSMLHKGGIASEIAAVAGVTYRMECNRYILKNGRLKVGDVLGTGAHRMQYRLILNAVGPNWDSFENKEECEFSLATTYYNVFRMANSSVVGAVNLPLLCLDQEIPIEISSRAFYHALRRFGADKTLNRTLKQINLVEIDDMLVKTVVDVITFMASEAVEGVGSWGYQATTTPESIGAEAGAQLNGDQCPVNGEAKKSGRKAKGEEKKPETAEALKEKTKEEAKKEGEAEKTNGEGAKEAVST